MSITIRSYTPADRAAVRRICSLTGYMGEPVDRYWRDERSFADMWTGYYTDSEPESTLVAERDGKVVGFLLGCVDSRQAADPVRVALYHAFVRGCLLRRGTAGILWRTIADVPIDVTVRRSHLPMPITDQRWPAHLHIDLLPEARRSGVGHRLMDAWLDHLGSIGSPGCHLETLAENDRAIAFFEAQGFSRHGPQDLIPGLRSPSGERHHRQVMVQALGQP